MNRRRTGLVIGLLVLLLGGLGWLLRSRDNHVGHAHGAPGKSITDTGIQWPSRETIWRTATLADYNTRVVFAGVTALGAAGGLVGTFLLLRKRSLLSDTVSHCTLPGIALAFLIAEAMGVSGRSLPLLLTGAAVTGVLGMGAVAAIRATSRVKDDAALAIVLSVFFGLGIALMGLVVAVTVIGLQAVGLLLVVAMLIIPAAAARFWSHRLGVTMLLATLIGAASGLVGVAASALFPKLPAGAVIVLAAVLCFAVSFFSGARRGLLVRWLEQRRVAARVARQHLLRAIYEWCESRMPPGWRDPMNLLERAVPLAELRQANHWSEARLHRLLRLGFAERLVTWNNTQDACHLTAQGKLEARRVTRNHRLWETYLLHYADVAPQHIHHNADQIEHVIEPDIVNELEELLASRHGGALVPADPEKAQTAASEGARL